MITTSAWSLKWKKKEKKLDKLWSLLLRQNNWLHLKKRMSISNSVWWIMQEGMKFTVDISKISGVCSCTLNSLFRVHLTLTVCSTQQLRLDLHLIRGTELYGCACPSTLCACRSKYLSVMGNDQQFQEQTREKERKRSFL
jgi:hypothetical protein